MHSYLKATVTLIGLVVALLALMTAWIQFTKETVSPTPIILVVTATTSSSSNEIPNNSTTTLPQTEIPAVEPSSSNTPSLTNNSQTSTLSCLATQHTSLGNGWTSGDIFLPVKKTGEPRIFTHCPPMTTIQYDSIAVDDEITKVEMVCNDSIVDITNQFTPFKAENEKLLHWRSSHIELQQNCRIDFTIQDRQGEKIGLMIKESEP